MKYMGVDGCRGGWFAVSLEKGSVKWSLCETFARLLDNHNDADCVFVDIPIGLPAAKTREADQEARRYLPSHLKSCVFNTPVRPAIHAASKGEAKSINKKLTGKSLSEQSLGLIKKIAEVDSVLQTRPEFRHTVFESHPEICFALLAGHPPGYGKKDFLGCLERFKTIRNLVPDLKDVLVSVRKSHPCSMVKCDDVLDSFALALTARGCKGKPSFFPVGSDEPPRDETGLPMAIWYHNFTTATRGNNE